MNVIITTKNINASDRLRSTIEGKLAKLDKYFSKDIEAHVTLTSEKDRQTLEATIKAGGMIFRAQDTSGEVYSSIDVVVGKLSSQMSRFKTKLIRKHKDKDARNVESEFDFDSLPDLPETEEADLSIAKRKKFTLLPMSPEEAVLQMELLHHDFYVFLNMETNSVGIVYKRSRGDYGLLETEI